MRHSSQNPRQLSPQDFQKRIKHNPYLGKIYNYQDCLIAHPNPSTKQRIANFSKDSPLHVEIGCGSGLYISELAKNQKDACFVGFEIRYKRLVSIAKKIDLNHLSNVLILREKGEYLADFFGEDSLDSVHVNFPDPWAKKSQKKHRLLQHSFFETLTRLLKHKGRFFFKTDHQDYFHSVTQLLTHFRQFEIVEYSEDLHQSPYLQNNIKTEFEKLFLSKLQSCIYYLQFIYQNPSV